jgi:hypothetical protein
MASASEQSAHPEGQPGEGFRACSTKGSPLFEGIAFVVGFVVVNVKERFLCIAISPYKR